MAHLGLKTGTFCERTEGDKRKIAVPSSLSVSPKVEKYSKFRLWLQGKGCCPRGKEFGWSYPEGEKLVEVTAQGHSSGRNEIGPTSSGTTTMMDSADGA